MLLRRLKYPRTTGLIIRRTHPELYTSHIIKLFEEFPETRHWYNTSRKELNLPNGSKLFFGSAEHEKDMSNFYSTEFADIMPDEAQEFSQTELERLSASNRCTSNSDITPKMIFTFMPGASEANLPPKGLSYLKRVFVDKDLRNEEKAQKWGFIQAFSWDNIEWARKELARDRVSEDEFYSWSEDRRRDYFLDRTEYGATLAAISDVYLREAWLYGKWNIFKGQYFTNFSYERHTVPSETLRIEKWWKKWISCDWGYDHPLTVHWHAQDDRGRVITYRELWGREFDEIDLGKRITDMSAGEKLDCFPFSWDAFGKLNKTTRKSITEMIGSAMPAGMPKPTPADASPGSRISGWRLMHHMLNAGDWSISRDCPRLIECLPSLVRDDKNPEDVLKVDYPENYIGDDPADCARYGLQYMLGASYKPRDVQLEEKLAKIRMGFAGKGEISLPGVDPFARFGGKKFD